VLEVIVRKDEAGSEMYLIAQGKAELEQLGLVKASDVQQGFVVRMPKAYPFYEPGYKENLETIRTWMDAHTPNLHPVGRNGMFRYNNQDHSMLTAMLTVQNIVEGTSHDVWEVNVEEDYHESGGRPAGAGAPGRRIRWPRGVPDAVFAPLATAGIGLDANANPRCDPLHPNPHGLNVCGRTPLVLAFFVTGSSSCTRAVDALQVLSRQPALRSIQFAALAVHTDRADTLAAVRRHSWTIPVAYDRDGSVADLYGIRVCPVVELAYRGGTVARRLIGAHWSRPAALAGQVRVLLTPASG